MATSDWADPVSHHEGHEQISQGGTLGYTQGCVCWGQAHSLW